MLRPPAGEVPTEPGVYRFRDAHGNVIYVGKARNLRQRLSSYFADPSTLHPRTAAMVATAAELDWTIVRNEAEALSLEYSLIKEHDPRFNVRYRDDKSYPYLAISVGEEFPRVAIVREAKRKGTRYFGPYAHAWAIRETVDELLKVFPVRSCRDGVFRRAAQVGRPCLLGYIGKCSAPCVGRISVQDHRDLVMELCSFLHGNADRFVRELELEMGAAAAAQQYEEAARLRDRIGAMRKALEHNAVVFDDATDADVLAIADDPLEAAVRLFRVRQGRIRGELGFILEKGEDLSPSAVMSHALARVYEPSDMLDRDVPREVLVSIQPEDVEAWTTVLSSMRGSRVEIRVPQRGDKRAILDTASQNAISALAVHRTRRTADLTTRSLALREVQEFLGLGEAPLRIECLDISTLQGQDTVGSIVVFEDGLPRKSDYRTYAIRESGADDTAAVAEVVRRRYARTDVSEDGETPRSRYGPGLLLVDGGAPQVRAAQDALMEVGATDVPVAGLAKRLEEVWLPDELDPVILPRTSEGLYLLQRIRDEAHRTAVAFHRRRRGRRMTSSALDAIPGLGPKRAAALLTAFGSVAGIRAASPSELAQVSGIGPGLAATIAGALAGAAEQEQP